MSVSLLTRKIIPLLTLLTSQTLSQQMIEKKHVLVVWTGWMRLMIYMGRKKLEIAVSSKNSPVSQLWTSDYTTAQLCMWIFGLCFHLLSTLWNAVYLGLQLSSTLCCSPACMPSLSLTVCQINHCARKKTKAVKSSRAYAQPQSGYSHSAEIDGKHLQSTA